jgi:hypothetical protein
MGDMEPYRTFGEIAALRSQLPAAQFQEVMADWARTQAVQQGHYAGSGNVHLHFHQAPESPAPAAKAESRGWTLLEKLTPYFVIYLLFILGMGALAVALMLAVPPFMAVVATLLSSLVAVVVSAVTALGMVVALIAVVGGVLHNRSHDKTVGKMAGALVSATKGKKQK